MFYGLSNDKSQSIVSIFPRVGKNTYFVVSICTSSDTADSGKYCLMIEEILGNRVGLDRISSVYSENTASCVNARADLMKKYIRIVGVQDQAGAADLAIDDNSDKQWIACAVSKIAMVSISIRSRKKLKASLAE